MNPTNENPPAAMKKEEVKETAAEKFTRMVRAAAEIYLDACPVSVPKAEQQRVIDRTIASFRAMANRDPKLYECTPVSLGRAFSFCVLSGLTPGGVEKHVDLIPRKGPRRKDRDGNWKDGAMELEVQVGFRGYVALAERSGVELAAVNIFQGDRWRYEEGTKPKLTHSPKMDAERTWDTLVASYVRIVLPDGTARVVLMPRSDIDERRQKSDSFRAWAEWDAARKAGTPLKYDDGKPRKEPSAPWVEWPKEMAMKTVIRFAAARGRIPMDALMQLAIRDDGRRDDVIEGEVVEASTSPATTAPERQLSDRNGLDELEATIVEGDDREAVPVENDQPKVESVTTGTEPKTPTQRRREKAT